MITRKQYLKTRPVCKVTFKLNKEEVNAKNSINIVGEFNDWDTSSIIMKSLKNGSFTKTIDLAPGQEHQFRYLIDGNSWVNDDYADKYVFSEYGNCDNSVIVLK